MCVFMYRYIPSTATPSPSSASERCTPPSGSPQGGEICFWVASRVGPNSVIHPGGNPGANLESFSHRCYLFEAAFEWELKRLSFCPWVASRAFFFWMHTMLDVYVPLYTAGRGMYFIAAASPHTLAVLCIGEVRACRFAHITFWICADHYILQRFG